MIQKSASQFLLETDVLAEFVTSDTAGAATLMRQALVRGTCYTSMLNAMELFRAACSSEEREAVHTMLHLIRVLGFNARYAEPFALLASEVRHATGLVLTDRETMVLGLARASKLAIVSRRHYARYREANIVEVLNELPLAFRDATQQGVLI